MAFETLSSMAPEQLGEFLSFLENGIKAIGGLLAVYVLISLFKLFIALRNNKHLLSIQKDLNLIKKKLRVHWIFTDSKNLFEISRKGEFIKVSDHAIKKGL